MHLTDGLKNPTDRDDASVVHYRSEVEQYTGFPLDKVLKLEIPVGRRPPRFSNSVGHGQIARPE